MKKAEIKTFVSKAPFPSFIFSASFPYAISEPEKVSPPIYTVSITITV